jgi:hypothetical protein
LGTSALIGGVGVGAKKKSDSICSNNFITGRCSF